MKPGINNTTDMMTTSSGAEVFHLQVQFGADFPIEFLIQRPVDVPLCLLQMEAESLPAAAQSPLQPS